MLVPEMLTLLKKNEDEVLKSALRDMPFLRGWEWWGKKGFDSNTTDPKLRTAEGMPQKEESTAHLSERVVVYSPVTYTVTHKRIIRHRHTHRVTSAKAIQRTLGKQKPTGSTLRDTFTR